MTIEEQIEIKVEIFKNIWDKFPRNIKVKLVYGPPMVLMCMLMSEMPNLKINDDTELLAIQNKMVEYTKESIQ